MSSAFALGVTTAASAQSLSGFYVGLSVGHAQTTETVRFPQGADFTQINDVSGNTILPGILAGYTWSRPGGLLLSMEGYGLFPLEPYPTTIWEGFGRQYNREAGMRLGLRGRVGFDTGRGSAVYGIVGIYTQQSTYTLDGVKNDQNFTQPEFGAGAEVQLWRTNTRIRFDGTASWYQHDVPWYTKGVVWTGTASFIWGF